MKDRRGRVCNSCSSKTWRAKNPLRSLYHTFVHNARKRDKGVELTCPQFMEWCKRHGYHLKKGQRPEDMTIDRVDPLRGYSLDNIQMISHRENSARGGYEDHARHAAHRCNGWSVAEARTHGVEVPF